MVVLVRAYDITVPDFIVTLFVAPRACPMSASIKCMNGGEEGN